MERLDYEAELAVIIGRAAKNVKAKDAMDYIFGYTILNDVSARVLQAAHKQWYFGKSLDGFTPIGPTYGEEGTPDAMNAAWGGIADMNRIAMYLSGSHKTVKNILSRKAFTVSMADAAHVDACDYVGIVSGNTTPDKMARAGFHVTKSEVVDAPVIDELPMTLECKLISFDEESELLLGEIVNVSADERILDSEGKIDPQKLRPITFDPVHNDYLVLGEKVGNAFEDGKKLK